MTPLVPLLLAALSWPRRLVVHLPRRLQRDARPTLHCRRLPPRQQLSAASQLAQLPFEPRALPRSNRSQWFEGWFVRAVDHEAAASWALILGSLRKRAEAPRQRSAAEGDEWRRAPFDEHILVLAYRDGAGRHHTHAAWLEGHDVSLTGRGASESSTGAQLRWWSARHGGMEVRGDLAAIDVSLPGKLRLVANVSGPRIPWSSASPDHEGPEGWLARTPLLPCHYFVHSFGSPATYRLRHGAVQSRVDAAAVVHMERNYGEAFPVGYTWAQASAPNRAAFLVVTGGLFVIGPLTTLTYVIGFRAPGVSAADGDEPHIGLDEARGTAWDFRTTDLDRIQAERRPCQGELTLNATSRDGRRTLLIHLTAPPTSFGEPMPIPTQGHPAGGTCCKCPFHWPPLSSAVAGSAELILD